MELRERLSDISHEIWSLWMEYLFSKCTKDAYGNLLIPRNFVDHWKRQIVTKYADLSEEEKISDREQADKILKVLD